ncbi:unnamed protein product [Caenorhabditis brenneri]
MSPEDIKTAIEFIESRIGETEHVTERFDAVMKLGGVVEQMPGSASSLAEKLPDFDGFLEKENGSLGDANFDQQLLIPISILTNSMRDVITKQAPEAIENFKVAYEKYNPMMLGYTLLAYLSQSSTKNAMKENFESKAAIIMNVIGQLIYLEAFGSGLLKNNNRFNLELLSEKCCSINEKIDGWRREFGV